MTLIAFVVIVWLCPESVCFCRNRVRMPRIGYTVSVLSPACRVCMAGIGNTVTMC